MNSKTQFTIVLIVSIICAGVIWSLVSQSSQDSNPANAITAAWTATPVSDENGRSLVDVSLILSGAIEKEIPLGKFAADSQSTPQAGDVSNQLWWSGAEDSLSLEQQDTYLIIWRTSLNPSEQVPNQELTRVEVPSDAYLDGEDEDAL